MTTLFKFASPYANGATPRSPLVLHGSYLYGTTYEAGTLGRGTVFRIDPSDGTLTNLASVFSGSGNAPQYPTSGLIALGSFLYGTTRFGGQFGKGAVYKIDPETRAVTTVASFDGPHGEYPGDGGLATDGTSLFGTATGGGAFGHGTVFQVDSGTGKLVTVMSFALSDGDSPFGGVAVIGPYLYGTTQYGGSKGGGTLFRVAIPKPRRHAASRR